MSLQWQVSDTGVGISEQQLAKLFKPFSQVGGSERTGGAGLGLSICARLSEMMGANLRVVSEPGLGSSFSLQIRLPIVAGSLTHRTDIDLQGVSVSVRAPLKDLALSLIDWLTGWGARAHLYAPDDTGDSKAILLEVAPDPLQPVQWAGERVIATESGPGQAQRTATGWEVNGFDIRGIANALMAVAHGSAPPMAVRTVEPASHLALKVLVVEDNPINREILKEQLQALGVEVTLAEDGEQAVLRWQEGAFDLIITDVNMPKLDGYQLARHIRQFDPAIAIIGVTANAMREEGEQCLAAGMSAWLVKPLSLMTLRHTLSVYGSASVQEAPQPVTVAVPADDLDGWINLSPAMHRLFISTLQEDLEHAGQALIAGNTTTLINHVHRMNGALASVRAVSLAAACNECELALLQEPLSTASIAQLNALLQRLREVVQRMEDRV